MKDRFVFGACVFLCGILVGTFFDVGFVWSWWILTSLLSLSYLLRRLILCFVVLFILGFGYIQILEPVSGDDDHVSTYLGEEITWTVQVDAEVDVRRTGQKLTVAVLDPPFEGRALLNVPKYPRYYYGQVLRVSGVLEVPPEDEDFSYKNYLKRYHVYGLVKRPWIEVVNSEKNNWFYYYMFLMKEHLQERINLLFKEPYASFESGLLLGARKGIPDYLMEAFNITGLTHIIAISGYNISLVIILVGAVFSGITRRWRVVLSILFIICFTILVGMSAAVVRAAIMGSIGLVALFFGRSTMITRTLVLSALIMNIWNPYILPYDVGFQLSFAATCGVVYVSPLIEKWFSWCPEKLGIRESLMLTIAAQITTLPVILFHFGRLSLVSPVANVLAAPFVPLAMATGAIGFILSYVSNIAAELFIGLTWIFLEIIIQITLVLSKVPFAQLEIARFGLIPLIGSLLCLHYWISTSSTPSASS